MTPMGTDPVQIKLLQAAPLTPLPVDSGQYGVAVQNKRGQPDALQNAPASTWERLTPIVHFVGPAKDRAEPLKAPTASGGWGHEVAASAGAHPAHPSVPRD